MPLTFGVIDGYARRYDIEGLTFDWLHRLVGAMEEEYLKWRQEQSPPPSTK